MKKPTRRSNRFDYAVFCYFKRVYKNDSEKRFFSVVKINNKLKFSLKYICSELNFQMKRSMHRTITGTRKTSEEKGLRVWYKYVFYIIYIGLICFLEVKNLNVLSIKDYSILNYFVNVFLVICIILKKIFLL
jgi:hypothetical protein